MIGILCGLKAEARIADRIPEVLVACSAANPDKARAYARHMAEQGVSRLISFGLCAGLSPDLEAGDLLLGVSVMASKNECWEADTSWNAPLIEALPKALCVSFWGSDRMAVKEADKGLIFRRTGCQALDMESHIIAETAHAYGIPFNIIRAVSDAVNTTLPPAALIPLKEDGGVNTKAVWEAIKKDPKQIPQLANLGLSTFRAMRSLKQAVAIVQEL